MTNTLYMTKGLPASGKSYWAREYYNKHKGQVTLVDKDSLRLLLHNGHHSKANEREVLMARDAIIENSMLEGRNVICHDTNFEPKHEESLRALAEAYQYDFVIKDFTDVPLETCLERDAKRGEKSVGRKVILDMYYKYLYVPE